jgi:gamma-glutamyl-gamma-aminobutyrate hydrolase PuuD
MIVAVTQRAIRDSAYGEVRDALSHDWYKLLSFLNVEAVVPVPNIEERICSWLKTINPDMIILSGGNDVEYGQQFPSADNHLNEIRDRTEIILLEHALSEGIPVMGVCRGMQLIYAYYGGLLHKREGHASTVHDIRYQDHKAGTWSNLQVNSYHQYCIGDILPDQLIPIGYDSNDGTIEAFVHREFPLLGVMWHPERNQPYEEIDLKLFKQVSMGYSWR